MIVKAKKYGNSHVFPIPKAIFDLFSVKAGSSFELQADKNGFTFRPINDHSERIQKAEERSLKKYSEVFKRLADR